MIKAMIDSVRELLDSVSVSRTAVGNAKTWAKSMINRTESCSKSRFYTKICSIPALRCDKLSGQSSLNR